MLNVLLSVTLTHNAFSRCFSNTPMLKVTAAPLLLTFHHASSTVTMLFGFFILSVHFRWLQLTSQTICTQFQLFSLSHTDAKNTFAMIYLIAPVMNKKYFVSSSGKGLTPEDDMGVDFPSCSIPLAQNYSCPISICKIKFMSRPNPGGIIPIPPCSNPRSTHTTLHIFFIYKKNRPVLSQS